MLDNVKHLFYKNQTKFEKGGKTMNFKQLQTKLISLTNRNITQTEIGEALGITRSTTSTRFKTGSELKTSEIKKIADYFNVYEELLFAEAASNNDDITIPVYGNVEASMGYGVTVYDEQQTAVYNISKQLIRDLGVSRSEAQMIFAKGNSMHPTIEGGDSLLVDRSKIEIYDGKIYCIRLNGQLYAKRLQKLSASQLKVISDNKDYDPVVIDFKKEIDIDFEVLGEVRWAGRVFN